MGSSGGRVEKGSAGDTASDKIRQTAGCLSVRFRPLDAVLRATVCPHWGRPLAGQGVNLGFGDVAALTRLMEASILDGAGLGHHDYLRQYETERQQHNVPTMLGCDGLQKIYNTSFGPIVMARSLGLQATNAITPLKKFLAARAA